MYDEYRVTAILLSDDGDGDSNDGSRSDNMLILVINDLGGDFNGEKRHHGQDTDHITISLIG